MIVNAFWGRMYCVVYQFKVKPGMAAEFEQSWGEFTEAIYRVAGSLGSRLHKTEDASVYIAYAQWRSKESWQQKVPDSAYSKEELQARARMSASVEEIKVLHSLSVLDDKLKTIPHS